MAVMKLRVLLGTGSPLPDTPANRLTQLVYSTTTIELEGGANDLGTDGPIAARAAFGDIRRPYMRGALIATYDGSYADTSAIASRKTANEMGYHIERGLLEVTIAGVAQTRANLLAFTQAPP